MVGKWKNKTADVDPAAKKVVTKLAKGTCPRCRGYVYEEDNADIANEGRRFTEQVCVCCGWRG